MLESRDGKSSFDLETGIIKLSEVEMERGK